MSVIDGFQRQKDMKIRTPDMYLHTFCGKYTTHLNTKWVVFIKISGDKILLELLKRESYFCHKTQSHEPS